MLPRNQRQEALSLAYVRSVAAQAGVMCSEFDEDFGIDLCLRAVDERAGQFFDSGDQLDLQVRSSTRAGESETAITYDLDVRTYDLLRREQPRCPRILVFMVLPAEERRWLTQSEEALSLHRCVYWLSLRGAEASESRSSIRVTIPRENIFSVESLQALMTLIQQGETP